MTTDQTTTTSRKRSPSLAALLSFLWPGLGQLYLRNWRLAAVFAAPSVMVIVLLAYWLRRGAFIFAVELFAERTLGLAAVAIVVGFGAWRLVSVVHAFLAGNRSSAHRAVDRALVVALSAVIVVTHLGAGYYLMTLSDAGAQVFDTSSRDLVGWGTPSPSPSPSPPMSLVLGDAPASPAPTGTPEPTPTPNDGRVTILFTGASSGSNAYLFDTIMLVSYNPTANSIQMVSVPRDSASFPFYWGGVDAPGDKINALPTYVLNGHIKSPDAAYRTLINEVQYLVGVHIDYSAIMYLSGFVAMIDKLGGIDIVNQTALNDASYDWLDGAHWGFSLSVGPHHLDGKTALAYVRSRHSYHDGDWARSSRQQQVLLALLHKMASPSQILKLPSLIRLLGGSVVTDFPANRLADYISMGLNVPSGNITQVVLGPPYTVTGTSTTNSANCLLNDKVAALSVQLFGPDSLWYGQPAPANTCP